MIRTVTERDVDALVELMDANGLLAGSELRELLDESFRGTRAGRWIVDERDGPRGVAYYAPEPLTDATWNLLMIAVHPAHQSAGVGRAMMAHVEDDLRRDGTRILLVETSALDEFARTRTFYERLNYEREAMIRDYYREGEHKIIYRKVL